MKYFQHKALILAIGGGLLGSLSVYAANKTSDSPFHSIEPPFHITGTELVTIQTNEVLPDGSKGSKIIGVHKVIPSESFVNRKKPAVRKAQLGESELDYTNGVIPFSQSPGAVDLGMNNVPVLDQGQYGTCVTFSTTAAMDALLGKGNFISQQCSLELDVALGNNYWDGAYYPSEIIDPLKQYGLVQQGKCNAVYANQFAVITLSGYKTRSSKTVTAKNIKYTYSNAITLPIVKAALNAKHRVLIGFGLDTTQDPISVEGFNMTINRQITTGGLWACKQPSSATNYCGTPNAGHEVVIIGYDDNQQLLKIRNSWNTSVGDQGDFYMTYTFFETMSGDGTEVQ